MKWSLLKDRKARNKRRKVFQVTSHFFVWRLHCFAGSLKRKARYQRLFTHLDLTWNGRKNLASHSLHILVHQFKGGNATPLKSYLNMAIHRSCCMDFRHPHFGGGRNISKCNVPAQLDEELQLGWKAQWNLLFQAVNFQGFCSPNRCGKFWKDLPQMSVLPVGEGPSGY